MLPLIGLAGVIRAYRWWNLKSPAQELKIHLNVIAKKICEDMTGKSVYSLVYCRKQHEKGGFENEIPYIKTQQWYF